MRPMLRRLVLLAGLAAVIANTGTAGASLGAFAASSRASSAQGRVRLDSRATGSSIGAAPAAAALQPEVTSTETIRLGGNERAEDVTRTSFGLVAVGTKQLLGNATSWTSTDGHVWKQAPAAMNLRHAEMFSVAAIGSRVVAVGVDYSTKSGAVWTSTNGLTWHRVATGTVFASTWLKQVIVDGTRFAAVGLRFKGALDIREPSSQVVGSRVWVSATGSSWSYVSGTSTILVGSRAQTILSLPNGLVAAGDFGFPLRQVYAAAWSSPLDHRWLPSQGLPTVRDSTFSALGVAGDRIFAFGSRGTVASPVAEPGNPNDGQGGRHWSALADPNLPDGTLCAVGRFWGRAPITRGQDGLVVITKPCATQGRTISWSHDGVDWSTAPLTLVDYEPMQAAMARGPEGLVVVGWTTMAVDADALAWLVPDPTAP